MQAVPGLKIVVLAAALVVTASAQSPQSSQTQQGKSPRAAPADYQSNAKVGDFTIAADFMGHAVPTEDGAAFSSEDYVVVEAAFFGPAGAKLKLSSDDFSLRIKGKKAPLTSQPDEQVFDSLKDPEWIPPEPAEKKSKTSLGGGGGGDAGPPPVVHMPMELRRAMELKVRKSTLPSGDRTLPQAGLIFFSYRGKTQSIAGLELVYEGPAGKATIPLQP